MGIKRRFDIDRMQSPVRIIANGIKPVVVNWQAAPFECSHEAFANGPLAFAALILLVFKRSVDLLDLGRDAVALLPVVLIGGIAAKG